MHLTSHLLRLVSAIFSCPGSSAAAKSNSNANTLQLLASRGFSNLQHGVRSRVTLTKGLWFWTLAALAVSLHGCEIDAIAHHTALWRVQASYIASFQIIKPGEPSSNATLNSCEITGLPKDLQCNGNGFCREWSLNKTRSRARAPLRFCECDRDWADPECRTRRKSQTTAWLLSMVAGFLGADQFYLGEVMLGALKLGTLGGLGLWWTYDVFRIGSAPVYAREYRLAGDLPHWVFVIATVIFFTSFGYIVFGVFLSYLQKVERKNKELMQAEDEYHLFKGATKPSRPEPYEFNSLLPETSGYMAPINCYQYGACAPNYVKIAGHRNHRAGWQADQLEEAKRAAELEEAKHAAATEQSSAGPQQTLGPGAWLGEPMPGQYATWGQSPRQWKW